MYLTFQSKGHETKTFTKDLVNSTSPSKADIPLQTQKLFVPIDQNGLERPNVYAEEDLLF